MATQRKQQATCGDVLSHTLLAQVCGDAACRDKLSQCCLRALPCGHWCAGLRKDPCPPCLHEGCEERPAIFKVGPLVAASPASWACHALYGPGLDPVGRSIKRAAAASFPLLYLLLLSSHRLWFWWLFPQTREDSIGFACVGALYKSWLLMASAGMHLQGGTSSGSTCPICWDSLAASPCILMGCGHPCHLACARERLRARWPGPAVSFNFLFCVLCGSAEGRCGNVQVMTSVSHFEHPALAADLQQPLELRWVMGKGECVRRNSQASALG